MSGTYTLDELTYQLTAAAKTRGRKELFCAGDVLGVLRSAIPPAEPTAPGQPSWALLTGVAIIEEPSFEPGRFRLVHHDNCEVDTAALTVHHDRCSVTDDGTLQR